jgi:hypothetical protein
MGHQNDKLDPAFTVRRNLPRNIFNELELCIRIQIGKKNIGIKKHAEKVRFFFVQLCIRPFLVITCKSLNRTGL